MRQRLLHAAWRDDRGASAAEYALIAALIAMVVIGSVVLLGNNLFGLFDSAASSIPPD